MYKSFGYSVYRTVLGYYAGEENAYDMRKVCGNYTLMAEEDSNYAFSIYCDDLS